MYREQWHKRKHTRIIRFSRSLFNAFSFFALQLQHNEQKCFTLSLSFCCFFVAHSAKHPFLSLSFVFTHNVFEEWTGMEWKNSHKVRADCERGNRLSKVLRRRSLSIVFSKRRVCSIPFVKEPMCTRTKKETEWVKTSIFLFYLFVSLFLLKKTIPELPSDFLSLFFGWICFRSMWWYALSNTLFS